MSRRHERIYRRIMAANTADEVFTCLTSTFRILAVDGIREVETWSFDKPVVVAHWQAVYKYLTTGDTAALADLPCATVEGHTLETRPAVIKEYAATGNIRLDTVPWRPVGEES